MRRCSWVLVCALGLSVAVALTAATPCECDDDTLDCSFRDRPAIHVNETCPNALKVILKGNRLKALPEGLSDDVIEIDISSNRLRALPNVSGINPQLKVLVLSENDIGDVRDELKSLTELEVLRVNKNYLTSLSFLPEPCGLRRLDVSINSIARLQGPLQSCSQLERLNVASNILTPLPDGIFSQLTRLLHLDLANNPLNRLNPMTLYGPQMLEYLDLSQTNLHELPGYSFNNQLRLRVIHLSGNKLKTLPVDVFSHMDALEDLFLDGNQLVTIPIHIFDGLVELKHIHLSDNHLTELPLLDRCCHHLEHAFFHNNNMTHPSEVAFRGLLGDGSERYVDLNKNPLNPKNLRWLLDEEFALSTDTQDDCACGSVNFQKASVRLCVEAPCGKDSSLKGWVDAVRQAEEQDLHDNCNEGGCASNGGDEDDSKAGAVQVPTARRGTDEDGTGSSAEGDEEEVMHKILSELESAHCHAAPSFSKTSRFSICSGILAYFVFSEWNFIIL